jgi:hypothetical protein
MSFDLDQLIAELPHPSPPVELHDQVLGLVTDEMDSDARKVAWGRRRSWAYPGLALAAAALLMVTMPSENLPGPGSTETISEVSAPSGTQGPTAEPEKGDLDGMVPKGAGLVIPSVELMMSVRSQGEETRLDRTRAYGTGDELYFMAWVDAPADLALVRVDTGSVELVHTQQLSQGRALLSLAEQPLAWRLESGESSAIFALLAQSPGLESEALSWEMVVGQLEGTYDLEHADGVCSALLGLDLRCSAQAVRVNP